MGEDGKDGEGSDADMNGPDRLDPGSIPPAAASTFHEEIDEAVSYERTLFYRGLIAAGLVIVVVVVRSLFFA
jgi:hypothetical protein